MPFKPKYTPEQKAQYERRVARVRRAAKNAKFPYYIALACDDNPSLSRKMVSNVVHNKKWLHAEEVLGTVERVLKLPPIAITPQLALAA
jgi:hypothetical protein